MQPLAEGIETQEEWTFLADRGCPFGQGYFFSRPVPASEIERDAPARRSADGPRRTGGLSRPASGAWSGASGCSAPSDHR